MSYINKLDLLLEADGPSRRDFIKSVTAAAASSNLIPDMTGAANIASSGATAAVSSTAKMLSALNAYFLNNSKNYAILAKIGGEKLGQVHDFLHAHPHMTMEEATAVEPLARYFYYETDSKWSDRDGPFFYTCFDSDNVFGSDLERIAFNNIYYPSENPHFDTLTDVLQHDEMQPGRLFANGGELVKHLASHFGSFKNFFKTFADCVVEHRNSASAQRSGYGEQYVEDDLLGFLLNAKRRAPLLYKSLGLNIDVEEYLRQKNKFWYETRHNDDQKMHYEGKRLKHDFIGQLKKDGLLSDKFDNHIEIQEKSILKLKSEIDERKRIEKQERIIKVKNKTERYLLNKKKEEDFDTDAMSRWEDEGGALGPLDEAIKRLLKNIL